MTDHLRLWCHTCRTKHQHTLDTHRGPVCQTCGTARHPAKPKHRIPWCSRQVISHRVFIAMTMLAYAFGWAIGRICK